MFVCHSQGDGHYFPLRTLRESENPLLANEGNLMEDAGSDEESTGEIAFNLKNIVKYSNQSLICDFVLQPHLIYEMCH